MNDDDEEIDISAIYVLGDKKFDFGSPEASEIILNAMKRGTSEALLEHKRARNPVAVSQDGKVVILQPDEIDA